MNKFFTKIAALSVGLAMAIGVGVAVGSSGKDVARVDATDTWTKVTDVSDITDGSVVLIVGTYSSQKYYMNPQSGDETPRRVSVTISSGLPTNVTSDNCFTFKTPSEGTGWEIYGSGDNATKKLKSGASNNALRITSNNLSGDLWTLEEVGTDQFYLKSNSATVRYLSTYSSDFRTYTSNGNDRKMDLYIYSSGGTDPENPRGTLSITSPIGSSLYVGSSGNLSYSWTPNAQASSATISSSSWTSSADDVVSVDNSTNKYSVLKKGSATLTLTATDSTGEEYEVSTSAFDVTNEPLVLPDMPNGDYVKVTSAQDDYTGYYLIVYESSNVIWKGGLSDLDSTPNTMGVTITDGIIESSSSVKSETLNQHAFYIDKVGSNYRIACNISADKLRYIGRTTNSNGLNSAQSDNYLNIVNFSNSSMYVKSADVNRYIGFNTASDQLKFRYLASGNVSFYKKTTAVDTLRSIAIVNPTTSLKDGQKFSFGGSVTATYSISGTTGHMGITSGLTFTIGGNVVDSNTTMTRGEYEVTVTYNDGTTSKSNTYTLNVGYADATSVSISGNSEITVSLGYEGTFTATVSPSNAENSVTWSVTDTNDDPTDQVSINSSTGAFVGTNAGDYKVVATSSDGNASSYVLVHVSGNPVLEIDKSSATVYYPLDSSLSLTVTAKQHTGTVSYSWESNNSNVATVPNSDVSTNSVTIAGVGTATITVTSKVGGVTQATATCLITSIKTRSVIESALLTATYDFEDVTETGTRLDTTTVGDLNDYLTDDSTLNEPTISLPDYSSGSSGTNFVYLGNSGDGALGAADSIIKLGKSQKNGTLQFVFDKNITKVVVSAQKWKTNDSEGTITINGTTPEDNAGQSDFADVVVENLSASTITISTGTSSCRVFVKSIKFYSQQPSTQIGKTEDVVNLEKFIDTYLRSDLAYDSDPTLPVNDTTECETLYPAAKAAFNGTSGSYKLNDHQRELFAKNSAYTNELARLNHWAEHNGDVLNGSNQLTEASNVRPSLFSDSSSNATIIIVIISLVSLTAVGGYFLLKKKKEQ